MNPGKMDNKQLGAFLVFAGLIVVGLSYSFFLGRNPGSRPIAGQDRVKESIALSEFQITACEAADNYGACQTRLPKLKLVTADECCKNLDKCC
jgi:hypothetical protein